MADTIHVIFKTHLDVGFTDLAATVLKQYRELYIPKAIDVARELRERGGEERFIWTTGSWLIYTVLEEASSAERHRLETAIEAGDIRWHALPFTTHTELMDADLFRFGLSLSQKLDARFGVTTRAAKMTDVPGHTRSMVPLLAEAGVDFLHLGVNPASSAPQVPPVFRWRDAASGAEITVLYNAEDYGDTTFIDGHAHALAFAHTGDNQGPQSADQIVEQFEVFRQKYPNHEIQPSTLDAFAKALRSHRLDLPVVEQEIGDTWIHGVGTDPFKVARFRELSRLRHAWLERGAATETELNGFSRELLMVPEHTWGLDEKMHLGDFHNYTRSDFEQARLADDVNQGIPPAWEAYGRQFAEPPRTKRYSTFESSWREQRTYIDRAVAALPTVELRSEAETTLQGLQPSRPDCEGLAEVEPETVIDTVHFQVVIDPTTGAIAQLTAHDGRELADDTHPIGLITYQTFSQADYDRHLKTYNTHMVPGQSLHWGTLDFAKPGMEAAECTAQRVTPRLVALHHGATGDTHRIVAELVFDVGAHTQFGAPGKLYLEYHFEKDAPTISLRLSWFDKPANRLPEALWLSFRPRVAQPERWMLEKMNRPLSPLEVVSNGNRNLHAVNDRMLYRDDTMALTIRTLDAPLVAPGRPRLLEFDNTQPDLSGGMHINLYNNIWGTNFPMWCADDARFRFRLTVG